MASVKQQEVNLQKSF